MVEAELTGEDDKLQGFQTGFAVRDDELGTGHDLFPAEVARQPFRIEIKFQVVATSFCTLVLHLTDLTVWLQVSGIHAHLLKTFQSGLH